MKEYGIIVSTVGTFQDMREVGEILSWLGAACRASAADDDAQYCVPSISAYPSRFANACRIQYQLLDLERDTGTTADNGQCWRELFRNPTIALGYPIDRRESQEEGLEIPIDLAGELGQTLYATFFKGMFLLKGFCSALVPTRKTTSSVVWHYKLDKSLASLTYIEARKYWNQNVSVDHSCLNKLRHFIGWTKQSNSGVGR